MPFACFSKPSSLDLCSLSKFTFVALQEHFKDGFNALGQLTNVCAVEK